MSTVIQLLLDKEGFPGPAEFLLALQSWRSRVTLCLTLMSLAFLAPGCVMHIFDFCSIEASAYVV